MVTEMSRNAQRENSPAAVLKSVRSTEKERGGGGGERERERKGLPDSIQSHIFGNLYSLSRLCYVNRLG